MIGLSFGKYQILEEIHSGVISNLYKAMDTSQNQVVALKVLKQDYSYDQEIFERFEREAKIAKSLEHPNIIKIYDIGHENNQYYYTMKFINGLSLRNILAKENFISLERAAIIIKTVCLALNYAHNNQVIHRDIKPSNIMIDENGNVIILDFGIAKVIYLAQLTRPAVRLGTPEYMSPEQIRGKTIDGRSDLYSVGIVFFELLTGTVPFKGMNYWEIAEKIVKEKPPKASEFNRTVPKEIDELINKAIEKDRTKRFSTGIEMANAINQFLGLPSEDIKEIKPAVLIEEKKKKISSPSRQKIISEIPKASKSSSIGIEFWLPSLISLIILASVILHMYKHIEILPLSLISIGLIIFILIFSIKPTRVKKYQKARLLQTVGKEVIQVFPLNSEFITIGRDQPNGIELFKDSISRSHARITNNDGIYIITDLKSTNGTFVNGRKIYSQVLKSGDRIEIGGEILIFQGIE